MEVQDQNFKELNNLYKIRKTVLEMMVDRGISVPVELEMTLEQFSIQYSTRNIDIYINDTAQNKKVYIHFYSNESKNFGKNDLKSLSAKLLKDYEDENLMLILILKDKENSMVTKELNKQNYRNVEIFLHQHLIINITRHFTQPKFTVLTEDQERDLLLQYNTTKKQLPKIEKTDAVARYYGLKPGQIIQCQRNSTVSGISNFYRVCK